MHEEEERQPDIREEQVITESERQKLTRIKDN